MLNLTLIETDERYVWASPINYRPDLGHLEREAVRAGRIIAALGQRGIGVEQMMVFATAEDE